LDDIAAVLAADETKVWSETVVDRLVALRPAVYGRWAELDGTGKATQLSSALKPYGITTGQVWGTDPTIGKGANRRGIDRAHITETIAERNRNRSAS
jgi:S-DNA-T family DNA segregation ATPase FtsK/SpoIIIE